MGAGALREVFAAFGFSFDGKALENGNKLVDDAISKFSSLGSVLAGNAVVGAVRGFAEAFLAQAGAVQNASTQLGMATAEYQSLAYAANQADVGTEQFTASMATLARNSVAAASGSGAAASAFRALGVHLRNADGTARSTGDVFRDVAANMSTVRDPARQVALAQALLGEHGRRLLPIMHAGAGGVEAYAQEFAALGGGLSQEAIDAAGELEEQQKRLNVTWDAARSQLATALLPSLTWLVRKGGEVLVLFRSLTRDTKVLESALAVLGVVGAAAGVQALAPWLPLLAAFALLVLVVDDLWALIQGGDSVIGDLIDAIYGAGESAHFLDDLKEVWNFIVEGVNDTKAALLDFGVQVRQIFAEASTWWDGFLSASPRVRAAATEIADFLRGLFRSLSDQIATMLRVMFNPLAAGRGLLERLGLLENAQASEQARADARQRALIRERLGLGPQTNDAAPDAATAAQDAAQTARIRAQFNRTGTQTVTVPAPAPGPRTTTVTNAPVVHVHGVTDPEAAGRAAAREVERANRNRRDADHAQTGG